jgi:hypothetical protein
MKTESPSITISSEQFERLMALLEKKPAFDQTTDLIEDRKRMIADAARVYTIIYRDCLHVETGTVFDAVVQPSREFPLGRVIRAEKMRPSEERDRADFELTLGGESPLFKKLALYRRHGPTPDMTDEEIKRIERDVQVNAHRISEVERAMQHQIRTLLLARLQPVRLLVGKTISEARRVATIPAAFEVLDEGLRSPFPLPQES